MMIRSILTISISLLCLSLNAQDSLQEKSGTLKVRGAEKKATQEKKEIRFGNEIRYQVSRLSTPTLTLSGLTGGKVAAQDIAQATELLIDSASSSVEFTIISFTFTYRRAKVDLLMIKGIDSRLSPEMIQIISRSKSGDVLFIDNIKLRGPGKDRRLLPGLAFEII